MFFSRFYLVSCPATFLSLESGPGPVPVQSGRDYRLCTVQGLRCDWATKSLERERSGG